jgi:uncharacterized protein YdeI (YjbR/CyaY-like superfamily)
MQPTVPDDLLKVLKKRPAALRFFNGLSSVNRYAILYRIQDAKKPETRARRIEKFVDVLVTGTVIHPRQGGSK